MHITDQLTHETHISIETNNPNNSIT